MHLDFAGGQQGLDSSDMDFNYEDNSDDLMMDDSDEDRQQFDQVMNMAASREGLLKSIQEDEPLTSDSQRDQRFLRTKTISES